MRKKWYVVKKSWAKRIVTRGMYLVIVSILAIIYMMLNGTKLYAGTNSPVRVTKGANYYYVTDGNGKTTKVQMVDNSGAILTTNKTTDPQPTQKVIPIKEKNVHSGGLTPSGNKLNEPTVQFKQKEKEDKVSSFLGTVTNLGF